MNEGREIKNREINKQRIGGEKNRPHPDGADVVFCAVFWGASGGLARVGETAEQQKEGVEDRRRKGVSLCHICVYVYVSGEGDAEPKRKEDMNKHKRENN